MTPSLTPPLTPRGGGGYIYKIPDCRYPRLATVKWHTVLNPQTPHRSVIVRRDYFNPPFTSSPTEKVTNKCVEVRWIGYQPVGMPSCKVTRSWSFYWGSPFGLQVQNKWRVPEYRLHRLLREKSIHRSLFLKERLITEVTGPVFCLSVPTSSIRFSLLCVSAPVPNSACLWPCLHPCVAAFCLCLSLSRFILPPSPAPPLPPCEVNEYIMSTPPVRGQKSYDYRMQDHEHTLPIPPLSVSVFAFASSIAVARVFLTPNSELAVFLCPAGRGITTYSRPVVGHNGCEGRHRPVRAGAHLHRHHFRGAYI